MNSILARIKIYRIVYNIINFNEHIYINVEFLLQEFINTVTVLQIPHHKQFLITSFIVIKATTYKCPLVRGLVKLYYGTGHKNEKCYNHKKRIFTKFSHGTENN